jgi:hypothetical protein
LARCLYKYLIYNIFLFFRPAPAAPLKFSSGAADIAGMLKKVAVDRLAPGMYVHDLGVAWAEHPFTFNRFKLKSVDQFAEPMAAGLSAVYIDTDKGDDVHARRARPMCARK